MLSAPAQAGTPTPAIRQPLPTADASTHRLRVVTYNVMGCRNTDNSKDLGAVADIIRSLNPDLVGLQEIDQKTKRFDGVDTMAELARRTGLHPAFAEAMPFSGGSYGVGALSRFPIASHTPHQLPNHPGREPRAALEIETTPFPGQAVLFVNTHLDHAENGSLRGSQLDFITGLFGNRSNPRMILSGDLNATPESPEMQKFTTSWKPTWPANKPGFTSPSQEPKHRIDHILVHPSATWKILKTYTGNEAYPEDQAWASLLRKASDHLPVVVELELAK